MAQTAVTAEKTAKLTTTEISELQGKFETQYGAAFKYARLRAIHATTTGYEKEAKDGNMTVDAVAKVKVWDPLKTTLERINEALRPYNPDKDATGRRKDFVVIPSDGMPPDTVVLARIKAQAERAIGTAIDNATFGTQLSAELTKPPASAITPQLAKTATVVPAQQLRQEERTHYEQILQNAAFIINAPSGTTRTPGPNDAARKEAQRQYGAIIGELSIYDAASAAGDATRVNASIKKLAALASAYDSNRALQKALDAARNATAAAQVQMGIRIREAPAHPLQQKYNDLKSSLERMALEPNKRDAANALLNVLPDVWLLGENRPTPAADRPGIGPGGELHTYPGPREEVFAFLESAHALLSTGDKEGAISQYLKARVIFIREQTQMAQRAEALQNLADSMVVTIKAGGLPGGSDIKAMEAKYGIRTVAKGTGKALVADRLKVERERIYITSERGIHNGREDLESAAIARQNQIRGIINNKKYSDDQISDLEETFRIESRAINDLTALWRYTASRLDAVEVTAAKNAWRSYAIAAATLADPTFNPLNYYPAELRKSLVSWYRQATNDTRDDNTVQGELSKTLMRNPQLKYDNVLYGVYNRAYVLAPVNKAIETAVERAGKLMAARIYYEYDHFTLYSTVLKSTLNVDNYAADMKFYLENAIDVVKESGAPVDGLLLSAAYAWRDREEPKDKEGRLALAETRRYLAINLVALRAAEVYRENVAAIGNPAAEGDRLKWADAKLAAARDEFKWAFSVPALNGAYYASGLQPSIADDALHILAPDGLRVTEARAAYRAIFQSENARKNVDSLEQKTRGMFSAEELRKAHQDDRPAMILAAQEAEIGHVRLLASVKGNPDFMHPDMINWDLGMDDVFSNLSVNVGRKPRSMEATAAASLVTSQLAWQRPTVSTADKHMDHQHNLHEPLAIHPMGWLYKEIHRQGILHDDKTAGTFLRNLDVDSFRVTMRGIAVKIGTKDVTAQALLTDINNTFMTIYDARREELRARLAKDSVEVMVEGQKKIVPISEYVNSEDPRRYFVVRAQEALKAADARQKLYGARLGQNLFDGSFDENPAQAIMSVEQAIVSLSNLPPIEVKIIPKEEWETGRGMVVDVKKIQEKRLPVPDIGDRLYSFYEAEATVKTPEAGVESVEAFTARTGEERIYRWMFTANLGKYVLVCNPHLYEKDAKGRVIDKPYTARIMTDNPQEGKWRGKTVTVYPLVMTVQTASGDYEPVSKDGVPLSKGGVPYVPCHVMEQKIKNNAPGYMVVEWNSKIPEDVKDLLFKYGGNHMAQPGVGGMTPAVHIIRHK